MSGDLPLDMNRREWLALAGALPISRATAAAGAVAAAPAPRRALPDQAAFATTDITYLDAGSQHPISLGARAAVDAYLAMRALEPAAQRYELDAAGVLAKFAKLVNADVEELSFVQSTTTGEQMVLRALGITPGSGAHVVTDTLHFFGSIPLYEALAKQGVEVSWVAAREGRIELDDVRRAVKKGKTKLVALSLVSTINAFQHDLAAVCAIAHEAGAYVYADIIHAAGCVPLDLHASGVDFAATASYKWLMGDFGLGFLYVRKDLLPTLPRTNWGYYGIASFETHIYPHDPPGRSVADFTFRNDAQGAFALGTYSHTGVAHLHHSLDYILDLGVARIQAHARPMIERLKEELPKLGYPLMTPRESTAPMVTCVLENARRRLAPRMQAAKLRMTVSSNRFRASVSVFNDMKDIDRLLSTLGRA